MHKHDDNLWSQLSQEWLVKEKTMPDMVLLKRRMLIHQLKMIGLIFLDLLITVAVLYMFYRAYTDDLSISFKVWVGFGLLFAIVTTIIGTKQRLNGWRMTAMNTKSWLNYEHTLAKNNLAYAILLKRGVLVFGVCFHAWLIFGYLFDPAFILESGINSLFSYIFAIGWLILFWWVASSMQQKALNSINYLKKEQLSFNKN